MSLSAGGDIGRTLAGLCGDLLDAVLRLIQIEKSAEALRLFEGMYVAPLQVFNQLRFECLGIGEVDDADGNGGNLGDLRGAKTSRPGDDLEALFGERPNEKRREHALTADAVGQFLESRIFKDAAGIGLRLVEKRERDVAVFGSVEDGRFHGAGSFRAVGSWRQMERTLAGGIRSTGAD